MTPRFATRLAALLALASPRPAPVTATLASLNRAARTVAHPATPAYRLRRSADRRGWPFPADTGAGTTGTGTPPGAAAPVDACRHRR